MDRISQIKARLEAIKPWAKPYPEPVSSPLYSRSEKSRWDREAQDFRYEITRLEKELKELEERELAELRKDKERLDWLADRDNHAGQVLLPTGCVQNNLSSLRDAIDEAMAENPTKENSMSKEQEQRIINILVNEALRKDKERLEWLLENAVIQYYPTTHPDDLCRITSKDDVDEAMKGE